MIAIHCSCGSTFTYTDSEYEIYLRRNFSKEKKIHTIKVKGYISQSFFDTQTEKKYSDIKTGYGCIYFYGDSWELEEYEHWLVKNEGKFGFKLI